MSKAVLQRTTDGRCKLCRAGEDARAKFEAAFLAYDEGRLDEVTGKNLTYALLAERASLLAGESISVRSVRRHMESHSVVVDEGEAEVHAERVGESDAEMEALLDEIDEQLSRDGGISPSAVLQLSLRRHLLEVRADVLAGKRAKITPEAAGRIAAMAQKAQEENQREVLLESLTGGIGAVFTRAIAEGEDADEAGDEKP